MSRKVDSVKDINDSKETWRLAVRIMNVWSVVNNKGIEHLEMIVMDSLGDRIQVLIRHDHLLKWKEVIKENMTCIINNGSVYNNDFQWKVCDHSKKIVFLGGTTMKAIELQNIPPKGYFFKDFGEILQGKCKTDRLEDIIGVVSEINHIQSNTPGKKVVVYVKVSRKVDSVKDINDSKETWRLTVRIMDVWSVVNNKGIEHLEMIVMDSLDDRIQVLIRHDHLLKWKEVIKENMTCIINNDSVYNNDFQWKVCDHSKKIVFLGGTTMKAIELQNISPKGYFFKDFGEILQGKCKTDRLEVSNAWSGSKLLINEDIPEIQDFMSKLPTNEQKEKPTQSAKSLSNWSGGSQYSPVERFVHNAKCMSLSQFCKIKHETLCVTVATTLKFVVSKYGWFYYGCTRCSSKAPNPEKAYECSCGQKVEQPIPRYKIEIYVSNGESKYRFVFWDSECAAILGMTAEFMHNSMAENGEDDLMVYPDELEMLLNKKMAFRVKVQPTFSQASVWKLCDDEAFVKEIENDYIVEDNQSKTEYAKLVPNKENLETSAQTLSASGENDPESIILMTLAKDVVIADKGEKVDFEASGATQLSGTKPSKKLKIEPSS
ncbi:hypothetical protein KIW84_066120 [Lathyrus oleraceus]|uniref:Replication protein A 70 kDa DNA-binding subunit B/D first OB fold domain-containing protein n=1 Tax=Pisum sativum TaxID=3888 RepID=A0A9D4WH92_PEA|nr:hypothetical protein KIW84_066120 [Pisum sativum]